MEITYSSDKKFALEKQDEKPVPKNTDEVRLFLIVRNEIAKLPYFFSYYRNLGVGRFFVIDDGSDDGSREFLLEQGDCHVFNATNTYHESECTTHWQNLFSDTYGVGYWCLAVDADELLIYPDCEKIALPSLCQFLDSEGSSAFFAFLLDMYPSTDLSKTICVPGTPFQEICPFFDKDYEFIQTGAIGEVEEYPPIKVLGGPRMRRFYPWQRQTDFFSKALSSLSIRLADKIPFWGGDKPHRSPALVKMPLVKWQVGSQRLTSHVIAKPKQGTLSTMRGALMHFKFFADFHNKAKSAVASGQYHGGSQEYQRYLTHLSKEPNLSFMYSGSQRYADSNSALRAGIISSNESFDSYARSVNGAS